MDALFTLQGCLILSAALFSIGVYGVLARRNLIIVLMSVELMLNGVNLALVAFARHAATLPADTPAAAGAPASGQVLVLMSMAVAAAEVAVGLSLLIALFRHRQTVDSTSISLLEG